MDMLNLLIEYSPIITPFLLALFSKLNSIFNKKENSPSAVGSKGESSDKVIINNQILTVNVSIVYIDKD